MLQLDLKTSINFLFSSLVIVVIFSYLPSSYADRIITIEKSENVKQEALVNTITDLSKYPQIFPGNVKYVKLLNNNTNLVEMSAGINGVFFNTQAVYKTYPDGKYVVEVVSGDLRGTTMTTELKKTWGFHGEKNGGTLANVSLDIKSSGFLSWMLNFVPDSSLTYILQNGLDRFAQYTLAS